MTLCFSRYRRKFDISFDFDLINFYFMLCQKNATIDNPKYTHFLHE
ncbi:hypothetical protein J6W78_00170 [bacterium]|nr:hypothetical protein [bacterium]